MRQVRTRLTVAALSIVSLFAALTGLVSFFYIEHDLRQSLREFAIHEAEEVSNVVASAPDPATLLALGQPLEGLFPEDGVISLEIWTPEGELVWSRPRRDAPLLGNWPEGLAAAREGRRHWSTFSPPECPESLRLARPVSFSREPRWLVTVAVDVSRVHESHTRFALYYVGGLVVLLLVTASGTWLLVTRALSPVHDMVRDANALLAAGNFEGRLAPPLPGSELFELASLVNALLDRTEETIGRLRRFTAHAGHELRTPLARVRGEVEQALRSESPEEARTALQSVLEEVDVQRRVLDALLELAHDQELLALDQEPTLDLATLAEEIALEAGELGAARGLRVVRDLPAHLPVRGSRALLARVLWNLLDNALKYAPAEGEIRVEGEARAGWAEVRVTNQRSEELPPMSDALFEPFARGGGGSESHGLGLPLSRAIARRHGGGVTGSERPEREVQLVLRLPLAEA
ncbi:MAG TPA: hypothetical protein DEA08_31725 [Planctomycetes bacterium]|nr:hypothetical protein [Planctomycetota bacterium]